MRRSYWTIGLTALAIAGAAKCAAPALAHVIAPQYSIFDNGALHAVTNLQMLVPLLALGVALGRGERVGAAGSGLLWLAAFVIGAMWWNRPGNPFAGFGTPIAFLAVGLALMSSGSRWAAISASLAAVVVGIYTGGIGRLEDASPGLPGWFTLGIAIGAGLAVFFATEGAASYRRAWLTIPVRIAASWLLAIGLMFFGLALKPPTTLATTAVSSDGTPDVSSCPGPHRHGLDGEIICLPVPTIDKAGTPSSIARYGNGPPVLDGAAGQPRGGQAAP